MLNVPFIICILNRVVVTEALLVLDACAAFLP